MHMKMYSECNSLAFRDKITLDKSHAIKIYQ